MRSSKLTAILVCLAGTSSAQLIVPYIDASALSAVEAAPARNPTPPSQRHLDLDMSSRQQTISDHLGSLRNINIFSGLTRDVESVNSRLETAGGENTLLCPLNSALTALDHKPWQRRVGSTVVEGTEAESLSGSGPGSVSGSGPRGAARAGENLQRFVEGHVVLSSPWMEGQRRKTMAGDEIWWTGGGDGVRKIMPYGVEVESVQKRAGNGEIWILKGVLA